MELQPPLIIGINFFLEKLTEAFNSFAGSQGYAIVKQRTKKYFKTNEVFKVYCQCNRGGKSEDIEHDPKRKHAVIRMHSLNANSSQFEITETIVSEKANSFHQIPGF